MRFLLAFLMFLLAAPAYAEVKIQLPTAQERKIADVASWATVAPLVVMDTWGSWKSEQRGRAFLMQGTRLGVVYGSVFLMKMTLHRARPCAPDCGIDNPNYSFFSGHTALAFQTRGGPRLSLMIPLSISTGGLRVAAGKHWITDTLAGAGVGYASSFIR